MRTVANVAAVLIAGAMLTLGGCVVAPAGPHMHGTVVVRAAPPAPRYEVVGVAPVRGHVWIEGYWNWTGRQHVWVPGYWSAPQPGHYWVPHRWEPHHDGWAYKPGHWQRR